MAILPESIEEVKAISNVYDVISEYLDLQRAGSSYKALCPFHSEKTPSFYVSPQKNIWKCFGCGKSGNAISFLMEYEGISYSQAIQKLADKYGIKLKFTNEKQQKYSKELLNVIQKVAQFYKEQLKKYPEPRKYLTDRGILPSTIDKFDIGYSPEDNSFIKFVEQNNINKELLVKSGIISTTNSTKDKFSGRIIFPIKNSSGHIVAFGGRSIKEGHNPKYLNSPETQVYQKSKILYGFYEAKEYIREDKSVVLVEGYFDVISPYQSGLKNIVATLGTSLTLEQARLIKNIIDKVYIMYDADNAGKQATIRASKILLSLGIQVLYSPIEKGKDPDELAKSGYKALKEHLDKSTNFLDFLIESISLSKDKAKKTSLIKIFLDVLSTAEDKILVGEYINTLSQKVGTPVQLLLEELNKYRNLNKKSISKSQDESTYLDKAALSTNEKIILSGLIYNKEQTLNLLNIYEKIKISEYFKYMLNAILNDELEEEEIQKLKKELKEYDMEAIEQALKHLNKLYLREELETKTIFSENQENLLQQVYELIKSQKGG